MCRQLISLNFCQLFYDRKTPISISELLSRSCRYSPLTKLKVNVETFDDCLYLLEGHLKYLSTLIIDVKKISSSSSNINRVNITSIVIFWRSDL